MVALLVVERPTAEKTGKQERIEETGLGKELKRGFVAHAVLVYLGSRTS